MSRFDAIVAGAGPAGSVCAAALARSGRRVLLLDRARFPRDKVCGDCLNPSVWPILDRLDLSARARALPHVAARAVSYQGIDRRMLRYPIRGMGETVVKRRDFDSLLVGRARELGVDFLDGTSVTGISGRWTVETTGGAFSAPLLFAADGRNSSIARLAGLLPPARRERAAIQCHCPRPPWHGDEVRMLFHASGYGGTAAVSAGEINVCLVAPPGGIDALRRHAEEEFGVPADAAWRTIAPLSRGDARTAAGGGLFLLGDAARVVEPFTGEGISYAMRSGELAAEAAVSARNPEAHYRRAHAAMYRGRLWTNRLARLAGMHPRMASLALRASRAWPAPLGALTARVVSQT